MLLFGFCIGVLYSLKIPTSTLVHGLRSDVLGLKVTHPVAKNRKGEGAGGWKAQISKTAGGAGALPGELPGRGP